MLKWCLLSAVIVLATAVPARAHQPILSDGSAGDAASAISLGDVDVSKVVYHEVTASSPRLWLTFDGAANQSVHVQLGLPFIDRLATYRPSLALVGPGLPTLDLPFSIPAGLGGVVIPSSDVASPTAFDEPFSGTRSWILLTRDITLPEAGTYYIVAFDPGGQPGKLWVATGLEEAFSLDEIAQLPGLLQQVRTFHETSAGAPCFLLPLIGFTGLSVFLAQRRASLQRAEEKKGT